jgi:hypothetical protein
VVTDIIIFHTLIILRLEMIDLFYSVQCVSTVTCTLYIHGMVYAVLLFIDMDVILHYLLIESEFEFESTWTDAIYLVP